MKRVLFAIALTAVVTVSCGREEAETVNNPVEHEYTFVIEDGETRATLDDGGVLWVANDRVGMFLDGYTGYANVNTSTTPKQVTLYSKNEIPAGSYAYAYYPYKGSNTDKTETVITLATNQDGGSISAMPMAGIPFLVQNTVEVSGNSAQTNGTIRFVNLGAIIDFRVFSTNSAYASETLQYVKFQADGVSISGDATIDLTALSDRTFDDSALELSWSQGAFDYVKVSQTAPVASNKDAATPVYMVVGPGSYPSGTITVGTDVATYTFPFTAKELGRNALKRFNMNLANATRVAGVVENVKTLPYSEAFTDSKGDFTIEGGTGSEWQFRATYGATVPGYYKDSGASSSSRHDVTTALVSPWIDLRSVPGARLKFSHAINKYLTGESYGAVMIQKEGESGWSTLPVPFPALPSSNYSSYLDVDISLAAYVGYKVKIKFEYVSTQSDSGTWEFRNFSLIEAPAATPQLGWLELPEYSASSMSGTTSSPLNDLLLVKHSAEMNSTVQRNYSCLYDPAMYASYWVAYPLCASHLGSGRSDDPWDFDPGVPTSKQTNVIDYSYNVKIATWSNSDNFYARGHQIPNADRNGCEAMRIQTFYMTNITPQIHYGLNADIWMNLESAVRDVVKSSSDTVYVVTGAAFRKKGENTQINTIVNDRNDSKVIPVPNYYWKALLKVKWNTERTSVTSAKTIGFWMPHEDLLGDSYDDAKYVVSIDQLEAWTGFDLFANLPDAIESTAQDNTSWSNFKSF